MSKRYRHTFLLRLLLATGGLITIFLILLSVIVLAGVHKIHKERAFLQKRINDIYIYDADLGYKLIEDTSVSFKLPSDTVPIIRSTDPYGRRLNPRYPGAKKHVLFFGGSYTYGQGCDDWNAMPWIISQMDTTVNVYNYALEGYGTQHMYDILHRGLREQVDEAAGTALYVYIRHHRERVRYDPFTVTWGFDFNNYTVDEKGQLVNRGKFVEAAPLATYFWNGISALNLWGVVIPVLQMVFQDDVARSVAEEQKLVTALIIASREQYLSQFPEGRFIAVIYPGESSELKSILEASGIEVLDLSGAVDLHAISGIQQDGFHPNPTGNQAVAGLIYNYLSTASAEIRDTVSISNAE